MVKWSEIEAECGSYKDGFVVVFRKYEGEPTDEKDKYNRPVKVTMASFARHFGIAKNTFGRWVRGTARNPSPSDRPVAKAARMVRTPEEREELVRQIAKVDPAAVEAVYRDRYPQPAASPRQAKEAEAWSDNVIEPVRRSLADLIKTVKFAEVINDLTADLIERGPHMSTEDVKALEVAARQFQSEVDRLLLWHMENEEVK